VKLVAYLRVSTDRQAEEGLGLEVQEQAIRALARTERHRVVLWARDEGVSGSNGLETREGLADALEALKSRQAGGLVVYRLDRLARDLVLQEKLLADVRRMGGEVFSTSSAEASYLTDDPDDPSRKLIRQVLGAVNEYERAMIALRLRSGRRKKHDNGGGLRGSTHRHLRSSWLDWEVLLWRRDCRSWRSGGSRSWRRRDRRRA
jgi:DNA invertase Pin-like site-specific DNA recombinase